ncbi:MAG: amidohydrolase family protein [Verrucomicrobia bacterium]|nr:amidohydrolase family protein [Verrucomicrobiota bacterium]
MSAVVMTSSSASKVLPSGKLFLHLKKLSALALAVAAFFSGAEKISAVDLLPPGHRPTPNGVHALVGGKIIPKPGEEIADGTIVLRDGLIVAVGKNIPVPADARVWDAKGLTIYAGFIDAHLSLGASNAPVNTSASEPISGASAATSGINFYGVPGQERDPGNPGAGAELSRITPEFRAALNYAPSPKTLSTLREIGFTAGNVTPTRGIVRGTSAFVLLSDANPNTTIVKADVFHHVAFDRDGGKPDEYPGSLMGIIAAVRQAFFDAQHYSVEQADYKARPQNRKRPAFNPALEALAPALNQGMPVVFEPGSALMVDRAVRVAGELGLKPVILACGQEWRRPDLVGQASRLSREANQTGGTPVPPTFIVPLNFPSLSKLPDEDDWISVSLDQLRAWDWAAENPAVLQSNKLEIALTTHGLSDKKTFRKNLRLALDRGLDETVALAALTTQPARLCGLDAQLGTLDPGKLANLTVVEGGSYFSADAKVREVWIDGRVYPVETGTSNLFKAAASAGKTNAAKKAADGKKTNTAAELREVQKKRVARPPMEGRGLIMNPTSVFTSSATIWTCGSEGIITNAALLTRGGKIEMLGRLHKDFSPKTTVINATNLHITPGIIDCHSHTAILGGVNESTIPSSAMVRVGDVVNSETENIYQQLAGGVTAVNLLHGSANPIGGQNQVIKLRLGASPEEMKLAGAPPGIKFALGENVKQSNWGDKKTTRFPQTRMGVPTFMANRFIAARQYLQEWQDYSNKVGQASRLSAGANESPNANKTGKMPVPLPPRRDLELEAIGEIIRGERLIHCHSYRQDEIAAFLRLMESFNVRVATLQHVLEGYKVADEIARHGAGGSTFSDWWAFKFEVYDAVPYNGSLMRERGVNVSFNSDSSELARRMNLEAAKAVKYGGTPEAEALKFITINPAKQLGIDKFVGSLEPGKDADFVVWSGHPLDSRSVVLQTWIDGKKYFDRALDAERTAKLKKERDELIAKAKKVLALSSGGSASSGTSSGGEGGEAARAAFWKNALEHARDTHVVDCQDCKISGRNE